VPCSERLALDLLAACTSNCFSAGRRASFAPAARRELGELAAVVEREHVELGPGRPCRRGAMQMGQLRIGIDLGVATAAEPVVQLGRCRMAGAQAWRETTIAPQALASLAPRRSPCR